LLTIHALTGEIEPLSDYKDIEIKRKLNGEYSLSFLLPKTNRNQKEYDLVENESLIEFDGQEFRVKESNEDSSGSRAIKEVFCEHRMFDLIDDFQYNYLAAGEYSLADVLNHIFSGSSFTYTLIGNFSDAYYEEDIGGQNRLALLKEALNKHGAEVEPNNTHITIGSLGYDSDFQFRYQHNVRTIKKSVDTNNLTTILKGYCDKDKYGVYRVESTYRSPMADIYGERHGDPVEADDLVTKEQLDQRLQEVISDKPEVNYTVDHIELKKQGLNSEIGLGDNVFTIWEPLNIDLETRVIGYVLYPLSPKSNQYEFGTFTNANGSDLMADFEDTKKQLKSILNSNGKLKYKALEAAVQQATVALQNSMTQLEYPEGQGIVARDPNNPDNLVVLKSNGLGISTDGGQTFSEAITSSGFVLSAGVIGKLKAQNIETENLTSNAVETVVNGVKLSEVFKDEYGGLLQLYDENENINVKLGVESGAGDNKGGTLVLYDDNFSDPRVALGIDKQLSAGVITLKNAVDNTKAAMGADSNAGAYVGVLDSTGTLVSYLSQNSGYINGNEIATVNNLVAKFG